MPSAISACTSFFRPATSREMVLRSLHLLARKGQRVRSTLDQRDGEWVQLVRPGEPCSRRQRDAEAEPLEVSHFLERVMISGGEVDLQLEDVAGAAPGARARMVKMCPTRPGCAAAPAGPVVGVSCVLSFMRKLGPGLHPASGPPRGSPSPCPARPLHALHVGRQLPVDLLGLDDGAGHRRQVAHVAHLTRPPLRVLTFKLEMRRDSRPPFTRWISCVWYSPDGPANVRPTNSALNLEKIRNIPMLGRGRAGLAGAR